MGKIYGLQGVLTGKVGNSVFAVKNGVQVVRQYQPVVLDPKSEAQTAARAKFKLLSQLSAVMAQVIAMSKQGATSRRNMFLKENYGAVTYNNSKADIQLQAVKLTKSVVSLPSLVVAREANAITVRLNVASSTALNRVVYCMFSVQLDNTLRFVESKVVSEPGVNGTFDATFGLIGNTAVVYAYGVRDNTEAASTIFSEMSILTATSVAEVIVTRNLLENDVTLTETKAEISTVE